MLLPGQLIGQDGQAFIVSAAAGVVFHQCYRVQQPHVTTGLPAEVTGRVKGKADEEKFKTALFETVATQIKMTRQQCPATAVQT